MAPERRGRRRVGDIVEVPLDMQHSAFGWVLDAPLVAFFDYRCPTKLVPAIKEIARKPIAFRIWVMKYALTSGRWPVLGNLTIPESVREPPWFSKCDPITRKVTITKTGDEEVEADPELSAPLEAAAVWDPEHVVDRLRDHFEGRPNRWVESLK